MIESFHSIIRICIVRTFKFSVIFSIFLIFATATNCSLSQQTIITIITHSFFRIIRNSVTSWFDTSGPFTITSFFIASAKLIWIVLVGFKVWTIPIFFTRSVPNTSFKWTWSGVRYSSKTTEFKAFKFLIDQTNFKNKNITLKPNTFTLFIYWR